MDRFADIEAFVAVVEAGSFSAAADRLETAKSAISRRVSGLEDRLGVKLLNRTTRRLSLTDNGRDFYARAGRILADLQEAEQSVSDADCELRGRIRLAAPLSFGLRHLAPAINSFAVRHPDVQFDLDLNDRQVNIVEEGFDMAIRIGQLADSSLIARRLCPIRLVAAASPAYLAAHPAPATPAALTDHLGLRYTNTPRPQFWRFTDAQGNEHAPEVPDRLTANNGELLARAAVDGLGVTVQPTFIIYEYLLAGRLQQLLPDYRLNAAHMYALFPPGRYLSRRVRVFADFLAGHFGDQPYWDDCLATPPPDR
jgi:DNA-binding transcriptional LysR family regulator